MPDIFGRRSAGAVLRIRNVSARFDGHNQLSHQTEAYQFKSDAEKAFLAPAEPRASDDGAAHHPWVYNAFRPPHLSVAFERSRSR